MPEFRPGKFVDREEDSPYGVPLTELQILTYKRAGIKLTEEQKLNGATQKSLLEAENTKKQAAKEEQAAEEYGLSLIGIKPKRF